MPIVSLARDRPDAYSPNLASMLVSLAGKLEDVGRQEDALLVYREAYEIRRALVQDRVLLFFQNYVSSLDGLLRILESQGRASEAADLAKESASLIAAHLPRIEASPDPRIKASLERFLELCGGAGSR